MPKTRREAATDAERWLDDLDPTTTPAREAGELRAIGEALTHLEAAEDRLQQAVDEARRAGHSWAAIGTVLSTSRQNAHRKFAGGAHAEQRGA